MQAQRHPITSGNGPAVSLFDLIAKQEANRAMLERITPEDYAKSVDRLVKLAFKDCGGSRAAAQVVLSLYNGNAWHVNLIDLCNLDLDYFRDCITAIRGRYEFNREPHEMINNGEHLFEQLQADWQHYHVKNRYTQ
jgi:hypothetical protein